MKRLLLLFLIIELVGCQGRQVNNVQSAAILDSLAIVDFNNGQFDDAVSKLKAANRIYKRAKDKDSFYANLSSLAGCYSYLDNHPEAIKCQKAFWDYVQDKFGVNSEEFVHAGEDLSSLFFSAGDLEKSIDILVSILDSSKALVDNNNDLKIGLCASICDTYIELEDETNTIRFLHILEEAYSHSEDPMAELLFHDEAAQTCMDFGNYPEALRFIGKEIDGADEGGVDNHVLAILLNRKAKIYDKVGDALSAVSYCKKAIERIRQTSSNSLDMADFLSDLAVYESNVGNYFDAIKHCSQAEVVIRDSLGTTSDRHLNVMNTLATIYSDLGQFKKANTILGEIVAEAEELKEQKPDLYCTIISNIGYLYSEMGNYSMALHIDSLALKSMEKLVNTYYDDKNGKQYEMMSSYAITLNNIAYNQDRMGNSKEAAISSKKASDIILDVYGNSHNLYATTLNNTASFLNNLGETKKAIELQQRCVDILRKLDDPEYASALNNLADYYGELNQLEKAHEIYNRCIEIEQNYSERSLVRLASFKVNRSNILFELGKHDASLQDLIESSDAFRNYYRENFAWLSFEERKLLWEQYKHYYLEAFPWVAFTCDSGYDKLYDAILFSKGILLNSKINVGKLIVESGDEDLINTYHQLVMQRSELKRLSSGDHVLNKERIDSLSASCMATERALLHLSSAYGTITQDMGLTWQDVRNSLGEHDVAIEFINYHAEKDTVKYAALILKKDYSTPEAIELTTEKQLNQYLECEEDERLSSLYDILWGRIFSFIEPGDNIFFAPSGLLSIVNIENLPNKEGRLACESYNLHRLSSTRSLCKKSNHMPLKTAVLFGGLDYDMSTDEMSNASKNYHPLDYVGLRGPILVDKPKWKNLPGTYSEVMQISSELREQGLSVRTFIGKIGTEESFKSLSSTDISILHIATHGFSYHSDTHLESDDTLSGLVFSGANNNQDRDNIPEYSDDGILYSDEISDMDFNQTDILVLSACETGLGDISSEGVEGIQYGFKQAGVNTIIMTLNSVNDNVTNLFMTDFYHHLFSCTNKRDAFQKAERTIRNTFPERHYWNSFIMLDDLI